MCLARGMYFSRKTAGFPKARPASPCASSRSPARSASFFTTHAASAAAKGRLDDQREPDFAGGLQRLVPVTDRFLRAGKHRHPDPLGQSAGGGLVAHHVQEFRTRPHERNSGPGAGAGELGIFAEESVAGMDGIHPGLLGQRHDALDVEVGGDRTPPCPTRYDSSALKRWMQKRSSWAYTATVRSPSSVPARKIRTAISDRLAAISFGTGGGQTGDGVAETRDDIACAPSVTETPARFPRESRWSRGGEESRGHHSRSNGADPPTAVPARSVGRVPENLQVRLDLQRRGQLEDVARLHSEFVFVIDGLLPRRRLAPDESESPAESYFRDGKRPINSSGP